MQINSNSLDLLQKRYFKENENCWDDLCNRVASAIADAEETKENKQYWYDKFYKMMSSLEFIPSTPCLINAGTNQGQLSSCFIIDIRDNIESIYNAKSECAKIFQKNGGVGFNISALRPKGTNVETSKGYSCGTVGFMEEFNLTADVVTRNNIRKGAIKIDLNDWHPDIYDFIHSKDNTTKLTFMNISVSFSDEFMNAVVNDLNWNLKFPDYSWNKAIYNSEWNGNIEEWESKGYPVKVHKTIKAKELYKEIMECAWKTGEPGVSYRDMMDRNNPNKHIGMVKSTNPCSEFCSVPYNSCNLGSINLVTCIENNKFNWNKFEELIKDSVRFLDNMITVNKLPLEIIEKVTKSLRSIGLGIMGYADCLYKLDIPYNSEEGYEFANELFSFMYETAKNYSIELSKEKGVYSSHKNSEWDKKGIKLRNSNFISIAPTGSISFIAGVSGGCEPNFALVYSRRTNEGDIYYIVNEIFKQKLIELGLFNDALLSKLANNHGSCVGIDEIPENVQKIFVTSHDITPKEHTEVVGIIQKHVDLSISKTVNLSNNATIEDIMNVYILAWQLGCKGITVYRDGCRENQTLSVKREENKEENLTPYEQIPRGFIEDVPDGLTYRKYKLSTGCGALYFFVGIDEVDGKIYDCFCNTDGASGCVVNTQAVSRLISSNIRGGIPIEHVIKQLDKAGVCPSYQYKRGKGEKLSSGKSCASAIGNILKSILKELNEEETTPVIKNENKKVVTQQENKNKEKIRSDNQCPECGEKIIHEGGCLSCSCGWSRCS